MLFISIISSPRYVILLQNARTPMYFSPRAPSIQDYIPGVYRNVKHNFSESRGALSEKLGYQAVTGYLFCTFRKRTFMFTIRKIPNKKYSCPLWYYCVFCFTSLIHDSIRMERCLKSKKRTVVHYSPGVVFFFRVFIISGIFRCAHCSIL